MTCPVTIKLNETSTTCLVYYESNFLGCGLLIIGSGINNLLCILRSEFCFCIDNTLNILDLRDQTRDTQTHKKRHSTLNCYFVRDYSRGVITVSAQEITGETNF